MQPHPFLIASCLALVACGSSEQEPAPGAAEAYVAKLEREEAAKAAAAEREAQARDRTVARESAERLQQSAAPAGN